MAAHWFEVGFFFAAGAVSLGLVVAVGVVAIETVGSVVEWLIERE